MVRHQFLVLAFGGSSPSSPATSELISTPLAIRATKWHELSGALYCSSLPFCASSAQNGVDVRYPSSQPSIVESYVTLRISEECKVKNYEHKDNYYIGY